MQEEKIKPQIIYKKIKQNKQTVPFGSLKAFVEDGIEHGHGAGFDQNQTLNQEKTKTQKPKNRWLKSEFHDIEDS